MIVPATSDPPGTSRGTETACKTCVDDPEPQYCESRFAWHSCVSHSAIPWCCPRPHLCSNEIGRVCGYPWGSRSPPGAAGVSSCPEAALQPRQLKLVRGSKRHILPLMTSTPRAQLDLQSWVSFDNTPLPNTHTDSPSTVNPEGLGLLLWST